MVKVRKVTVDKIANPKVLKKYWGKLQRLQGEFNDNICLLEQQMEKETGIENIEFVPGCDGCFCGIGNADRSMKLVQFE